MKKSSVPALILLFIVTAVVTAAARMPLSLVLLMADVPLQAEKVSGTIWHGKIKNAWVQGYPLGDVEISGQLLPLLTGKAAAHIRLQSALVRGEANVVAAKQNKMTLRNAQFSIDIAALKLRDAFGAPMAGMIEVQSALIILDQGRCAEGSLAVQTDTLERSAAGYGGKGFALAGTGECVDGGLTLPLFGEGPEGAATADIRIAQEAYMIELLVTPKERELASALQAFGFTKDGPSYRWIQRGEIIL